MSACLLAAEDLAADLGAERAPDGIELAYCRQRFIVECVAAGVVAVDCPYTWSDPEGVERDTRWARRLGYGARSLVDPAHATIVNRLLTPDDDEMRRAQRDRHRLRGRARERTRRASRSTVRWSRFPPIPTPNACLRAAKLCGSSRVDNPAAQQQKRNGRISMDRLKGKVAMVVGAGSIGPGWGNGKATAVTFAREGAQVFCVDRNPAAAEETVEIITGEGGKAMAHTADVSRAAEVEAMVAACMKAYGRIDVLDNNVGIAEVGSVVEVDEAEWDRVFAVNLKSAYLSMKHVIPMMVKQGGGSIINISSIASIRHVGISYVSYNASKAAMNQMTRTTAVEFAPKHVRVNAILPGLMKTPMVEHSAGLAQSYAKRRRGGDVARPRRAGADGAYGRRLGRRQRGAVPRLRRVEICHRHRARGRWRHHLQVGRLRASRASLFV